MSSKTIAKFSLFVILSLASMMMLSGCGMNLKSYANRPASDFYTKPEVVGHISDPDITEASGIAASKCQANVFWTHNDSGHIPAIYAINAAGQLLGSFRLAAVEDYDWEDIAEFRDTAGKCFVYIGEIGDNKYARAVHSVYRVPEPPVSAEPISNKKDPIEIGSPETINFRYADKTQNAETLMVHPSTGDIYVVSKNRSGPAGVYKIKPDFSTADVQVAPRIADLEVPSVPIGLLTGGDISPDGRRIILCDYLDGYELILPDGDSTFDDIWKQKPVEVDLGERDTGEAFAYSADGNSIFATTEGKNAPIIELHRR
jgi:hypothetical protein